jgi:hypothetical protein
MLRSKAATVRRRKREAPIFASIRSIDAQILNALSASNANKHRRLNFKEIAHVLCHYVAHHHEQVSASRRDLAHHECSHGLVRIG